MGASRRRSWPLLRTTSLEGRADRADRLDRRPAHQAGRAARRAPLDRAVRLHRSIAASATESAGLPRPLSAHRRGRAAVFNPGNGVTAALLTSRGSRLPCSRRCSPASRPLRLLLRHEPVAAELTATGCARSRTYEDSAYRSLPHRPVLSPRRLRAGRPAGRCAVSSTSPQSEPREPGPDRRAPRPRDGLAADPAEGQSFTCARRSKPRRARTTPSTGPKSNEYEMHSECDFTPDVLTGLPGRASCRPQLLQSDHTQVRHPGFRTA